MLTTIVVVLLFVVAFFMVLYEWATNLWIVILIVTVATWLVTLYEQYVKKDVQTYKKVIYLFVGLRMLTAVLAVILGAIWLLSRLFA